MFNKKYLYYEDAIFFSVGRMLTHQKIVNIYKEKLRESKREQLDVCETTDRHIKEQEDKHDETIKRFAKIIEAENLKIVKENKIRSIIALQKQLGRASREYDNDCFVDICECYEDWLDYNPKPLIEIPYCGSMNGFGGDLSCGTISNFTPEFTTFYNKPKDRARKIIIDIEKEIKSLEGELDGKVL